MSQSIGRVRLGGHPGRTEWLPPEAQLAAANYDLAFDQLDKEDCEDSLLAYIERLWSVLEPGRPFTPGRVLNIMCEHLEAVTRGEITKLLINVPPGCTKSMTTNVFWPSWEWGPKAMPWLRYIGWSYAETLTLRDNRRARLLIKDDFYQRSWGEKAYVPLNTPADDDNRVIIAPDQDAKGKFENTKRGWKLATSIGGVGTGERGDRLILDDPHNVKEAESEKVREGTLQWFTEVMPSRKNDQEKSAIVVIMQRVHARDVSGIIIGKNLGYDVVCLPMRYEDDHPTKSRTACGFIDWRTRDGELLWPERFSGKAVDDLSTELSSWGGTYAVAGQLQQRPAARGGGMFKKHWWKFFETTATSREGYTLGRPSGCNLDPAVPLPQKFDLKMISVDGSFKDLVTSSRVSIMVVGIKGALRYVLENITRHMTFSETVNTLALFEKKWVDGIEYSSKKIVGGLYLKWKPWKTLIEDKANGTAIIETLMQSIPGIISITPKGGKAARASAMEPGVEAGQYFLPDGAPWLQDFIEEHATFPVGEHDDQVDALSQVNTYMLDNADVLRVIAMSKM